MHRKLIVGLVVVAALMPIASTAQTSKKANASQKNDAPKTAKGTRKEKAITRGRKLFATHCASCHAAGENSVTPSKPVKGSQVLSTMATFKSYLNEPVGNMPHYEHLITDEKLLGDLYSYVKDLDKTAAPATDENQKSKDKKKRA